MRFINRLRCYLGIHVASHGIDKRLCAIWFCLACHNPVPGKLMRLR